MEHVAILKKSWGFLEKILSGKKRVESRWYLSKRKPWGSIRTGDTVFFKNAGEPVTACAEAERVIHYSDLSPRKAREILRIFGKKMGIEKEETGKFFDQCKDKKYCVLVCLKNPRSIKPFEIDKTGFGAMSAWITVNTISKVRRRG